MPGPPRTPTKILELRGSWLAKKRRRREPQPPPAQGTPRCPQWLEPSAKAVWRQLAPRLAQLGLLTPLDVFAFARYCEHYAEWQRCREFIHDHGSRYAVRDESGQVVAVRLFPEAIQERMHSKLLVDIEREFGLTPAARAKLADGLPEPPGSDPEDKSRFFRRER
jgi:P27 family predicted phage terminase small subunit